MAYKEGDLVKFDRPFNYSHWAVYVGGDHVVHLTGDARDLVSASSTSSFDISGMHYKKASVKEENINVVANGDRHSCGNSKYDNEKTALPVHEICNRARKMIGNMKYDIIRNNCEHFATWCRYGEKKSAQVERRRQQHWQYDEQQYTSWGFFNHPMADLIQLLLDHLYWPPAPAFRHPNGHRGQRRQHQQRHQ